MRRRVRGTVVASSLALALIAAGAASAQKSGGILKVSRFDSPASMSPLEEATIAALRVAQGPLAVIGIEQSAMRCGDAVANSTRQAIVAADAAEAGCR